jgi:hypothetical protein
MDSEEIAGKVDCYLPFVAKVRGLARDFATEQIGDFVKPHLG